MPWGYTMSAMQETQCLIPGLGRSPGERNGSPLQYSCLENLMDGGDWWVMVFLFWLYLLSCFNAQPSSGSDGKELPTMQETWVQSLLWEDPLEKEKATHSNTLAWRIPWTMGSQRVWHDWTTFTFVYYNEWYPFRKQIIQYCKVK